MVCTSVRSGAAQPAPSANVLVALRLRTPSVELMLEAEWVLERTNRVIPAVGTAGQHRHEEVSEEGLKGSNQQAEI